MVKNFHGNPYTFEEMVQIDSGTGSIHTNCRCGWSRMSAAVRRIRGLL